jgi:iron complex outermembrane recepter protein
MYNIEIVPSIHFGGKIYDSSSKKDRNPYDSKEVINLVINKAFDLNNGKCLTVFLDLYNLTNNKFKMPWQFKDTGFDITTGICFSF